MTLRRTREDVAEILRRIFLDEKWSKATIHEVVKHTGIAKSTVHDHRQRILSESGKYDSGERTFIHPKTGKPTTMDTSNIGRRPSASSEQRKPNRTWGGISPDAAKPVRGYAEQIPKVALELPTNDADAAVRALFSLFDETYLRALAEGLLRELEGDEE